MLKHPALASLLIVVLVVFGGLVERRVVGQGTVPSGGGGSAPSGGSGGQTAPSGSASGGGPAPSGGGGGGPSTTITNPEVTLVNYILNLYPSKCLSRPAPPEQIINASVSLSINNFNGIDNLHQLMSFSGIVTVKWNDSYIKWRPTQYSNITVIHLRNKDVWLPLIIQASDPGSMRPIIYAQENLNSERVWAMYNGSITAASADNFVTKCVLDLSSFPFDTQSCSYTYQGWNYPYDAMTVQADTPAYVALDSALYNSEWIIMNITTSDQLASFNGEYYSCVKFTITATRRSTFYVLNVLLPCIVMACLALSTFLFPMDTSRAGFAVTVVLAFAVFQTLVVSALPKTSDQIPLVMYIVCQMFVGGFITFYSIFISWLVGKNVPARRPMPRWLGQMVCRFTAKPYRGRSYPEMLEISKSSSSPELTQAALMVIKEMEKREARQRWADDWTHFFNLLDMLAMLICLAASIVLPVLIFSTSTFKNANGPSSSPIVANNTPKFIDRPKPTAPPPPAVTAGPVPGGNVAPETLSPPSGTGGGTSGGQPPPPSGR